MLVGVCSVTQKNMLIHTSTTHNALCPPTFQMDDSNLILNVGLLFVAERKYVDYVDTLYHSSDREGVSKAVIGTV